MSDKVTDAELSEVLKASAMRQASALLPTEAKCTAAGRGCFAAGVSIDELFTLHAQARAGGSERAWSWILNGYYDVADDAEQSRLMERRADLEVDA